MSADLRRLFKLDQVTHTAGVEVWVVLTTLLLVVKFVIDTFGPWRFNSYMGFTARLLEGLNSSMVTYTIGIMQLSTTKNDFFQVWAVLMVTLRYSVKVGRPYGTSKQLTLSDMLNSLWTANLLRSKTSRLLISLPLWIIWTLNAVRIIAYFVSSERASRINKENLRLVTDYMKYEHELSEAAAGPVPDPVTTTMRGHKHLVTGQDELSEAGPAPDPVTMRGYKYLVTGEDEQDRKVKAPDFSFKLDVKHGKLITTESVWSLGNDDKLLSKESDTDSRFKDVCLSFALYKLLSRRFNHLPSHEAAHPKTRRLILEGILQVQGRSSDDKDYDRAFRITEVELSLLQDSLYGNHAVMFVNGFPCRRVALSVVLVAVLSFLAYPVYSIPRRSTDNANLRAVTHGVPVSYGIILLIIGKEVWELCVYIFSQWTKVWMVCTYITKPKLRCSLMRAAVRLVFKLIAVFRFVARSRWNQNVRQYNLLIQCPEWKLRLSYLRPTVIKLPAEVKREIFELLKRQQSQRTLGLYFSNAFESKEIGTKFAWADEFEADTHRILVWHIATCLCEIELCGATAAAALKPFRLRPRLFVPESGTMPAAMRESYKVAVTLSNYCAYLLTRGPRLVPDGRLVSQKVFFIVKNEVFRATSRCTSLQDIHDHLLGKAAEYDGEGQATVKMGAALARQLLDTYGDGNRGAGAWQVLAKFWTGFLLHLAALTEPSRHRAHLQGRGELITHLWALLSHAGFLGTSSGGDESSATDDEDGGP